MPQPFPGTGTSSSLEGVDKDPIDEAELVKDRVRQLLRRYGILFRELVAYELPLLQWANDLRALRLMELSGEILSGHFFEGIPGIQFISHEAFRFLNEPFAEDRVYWMNAVDPASLCGIRLDSLKGVFPSRIPSTHLAYRGKTRSSSHAGTGASRSRSARRSAGSRLSLLFQGAPFPGIRPGENHYGGDINGKPAPGATTRDP